MATIWDITRLSTTEHVSAGTVPASSTLTCTSTTSTDQSAFATTFHSSGKWVLSMQLTDPSAAIQVGFAASTEVSTSYLGNGTLSVGVDSIGALINGNGGGSFQSIGVTVGTGQIDMAIDITNRNLWVQSSVGTPGWNPSLGGNPLTGSGAITVSGLSAFNLSPAGSPRVSGDIIRFLTTSPTLAGFTQWDPSTVSLTGDIINRVEFKKALIADN